MASQPIRQTPPPDDEMQRLRKLLLGEQREEVTQVVKEQARDIVGDVISEAMHDRQKQDGSVNQVLIPLVEKSVEKSVSQHSEKMVGYLYPLVGRLVRKSVTAFVNEFLEKTNELIENSLTIKGMKWRFRAWRAGVSFSQYVASQTFMYRVEQVMLIHRETGILLKNVGYSRAQGADADMVSGMLTAINDFVSDSFTGSSEDEQHLDVVKTADFSLYIKQGPQAILVAAVTGNLPPQANEQLQITLETIHSLYGDDLSNFEGDTLAFESSEQQLRECLLAELKPELADKKRPPWMALILVSVLLVLLGWYGVLWFKQNQLANAIKAIDAEPGITLKSTELSGLNRVTVSVLRDPEAIPVVDWLQQQNIDGQNIDIVEQNILSLDAELVAKRLTRTLAQFPSVTLSWQEDTPVLSGTLSNARRQSLARSLAGIPGLENSDTLISAVGVEELESEGDDTSPEMLKALLDLNVAKIDRIQLEFDQGISDLSEEAKQKLVALSGHFKAVTDLAERLQLNVGLIIMGASDGTGNPAFNKRLSLIRATAAQRHLVELGVEPGYLNPVGLGVVEHGATGTGARNVLFNVVYFDSVSR